MILAFIAKIRLRPIPTNIATQNIDDLSLEIYNIVLAIFSLQDYLRKVRFFETTFLLTNTSMEVVLEMLFLIFNNIDFEFSTEELT